VKQRDPKPRRSGIFVKGIFVKNPIFAQTIGLCPVIAVCNTLKNALALAFLTGLLLVAVCIFTSIFLKRVAPFIRCAAYFALSMAVLLPVMLRVQSLFPVLSLSLGVYLPLTAVNSVIIYRCEEYAVKKGPVFTFYDATAFAAGVFIAMCLVGGVREIFGDGKLYGVRLAFIRPVPGLMTPFGGFIVLGFFAAGLKWLTGKLVEPAPELAPDAFMRRDADASDVPQYYSSGRPEPAPEADGGSPRLEEILSQLKASEPQTEAAEAADAPADTASYHMSIDEILEDLKANMENLEPETPPPAGEQSGGSLKWKFPEISALMDEEDEK